MAGRMVDPGIGGEEGGAHRAPVMVTIACKNLEGMVGHTEALAWGKLGTIEMTNSTSALLTISLNSG